MKNSRLVCGLFLLFCLLPGTLAAAPSTEKKDDILLTTMQAELKRAQDSLGKLDPAVYFLSYTANDESSAIAVGTQGTVLTSIRSHRRTADVVVRVGTPALDNTHLGNRVSAIFS